MANSNITIPGDGTTTVFSFPFQYLERSHISVAVDGSLVNFTFPTNSTVQVSPAPGVGVPVRITRTTPTEPVVDFRDGETLTENDLDKVALQSLYIAEESNDNVTQTVGEDAAGNLDASNRRLVNVATPVNNGDAATKQYVDAMGTDAANSASAAAFSANSAGISSLDAAQSAQDAEAHLDEFYREYLGPFSTPPTVDNEGGALQTGTLYWQTTGSVGLYIWNGSAWAAASDYQIDTSFIGAVGSADQAWIVRTGVRNSYVQYRNTTGKAIAIIVYAASFFDIEYRVLSTDPWITLSTDASGGLSMIIPNGHHYRLNSKGLGSGQSDLWLELRE